MSAVTPVTPAPRRTLTVIRRAAWFGGGLFWSAFAVLEAVNHGWVAGLLAFAALIVPDLTMLIGIREAASAGLARGRLAPRAVPYYNAVHHPLVPLALMLLYTFGPVAWAPAFAALCGWMAHISYDRAFGYGPRTKEGYRHG
jgi:hypothetical protein